MHQAIRWRALGAALALTACAAPAPEGPALESGGAP